MIRNEGLEQTYLLTYLYIPYSTVLLEKLTGLQLVKKFPAFYGTRRFITAFTSTRHLTLSWASSIQSIPPHPTSLRSILTHWGRGHLNCLNARYRVFFNNFNPLNAELNPISYLLALLAHHFLHVSRMRVKSLTLRLLMSYIYIYIWH